MRTYLHQGRPMSRTVPYSGDWNMVIHHGGCTDNLKHKWIKKFDAQKDITLRVD